MNTFTHILSNINWVDVAMLVLFIRIIFIGVKTGFVTELFKLSGVFCAVFVALHYYTSFAVFVAQKTNWPIDYLELSFFVLLVCSMVLVIKLLRDGFLMLFKFETTHAGFNQWGAGVLAMVRVLFLSSLIVYGILLSHVEYLQRQTLSSVAHRLVLKAAPNTYIFLYHNFIGKVFTKEKFNEDVLRVSSRNGIGRKPL